MEDDLASGIYLNKINFFVLTGTMDFINLSRPTIFKIEIIFKSFFKPL
jgi:hypothetical protein